MPHPIGTQISEFFFLPKKKRLFFKSNEAEIICLHCVLHFYINYFYFSENKREEKLMLRLVGEW